MGIREKLRTPFVSTCAAARVNLLGKQIIVTGCGAGSLGYATAQQLARWGARVIITTRRDTKELVSILNADLARHNSPGNVDGYPLDLSSAASVNEFTQWYERCYGDRLDVLVNNAGIHLDLISAWKQPELSSDGVEIHWRTNYLGTVHLTHNLLGLLQQSGLRGGDARVVNVVSQLHSRGSNALLFDANRTYESWQAYGLSKLGLIHFTNELQRRFSETDSVRSYSVHPGGRSGAYTNVATRGLEGHAVIGMIRKVAAPLERLLMASADEGAQTQIHCATAPAALGGHYYVDCKVAHSSRDSVDEQTAHRLWEETQAWLNAAQMQPEKGVNFSKQPL